MPLDKLTLHAQLAVLADNAKALDTAIVQKTKAIQEASIDLEHTRGARAYHDMVVTQVNNQLAELARQESATPAS